MLNKTVIGALIISILYGLAAIPASLLAKDKPYPVIMMLTSSIYFLTVFIFYSNSKHTITYTPFDNYDMFYILILAVFCTWLPNIIYYYIINEKNTTLVSAISAISPLWTLVFSYIFLTNSTKITLRLLTGISLIIIGIYYVSTNR